MPESRLTVTLSDTIAVPIWEKFILLTGMSGVTAITRLPIGKLRDDPDILALYENEMRETAAVGRAEGVPLADEWSSSGWPVSRLAARFDGLDGGRSGARQRAGTALARRKGRRSRPKARHPDTSNGAVFAALKPYANGKPA